MLMELDFDFFFFFLIGDGDLEDFLKWNYSSSLDIDILKLPFSNFLPSNLSERINNDFNISCSEIMKLYLDFIKLVKTSRHIKKYKEHIYKLSLYDFINNLPEIIEKVIQFELNNKLSICAGIYCLSMEAIKYFFVWQENWDTASEDDIKMEIEDSMLETTTITVTFLDITKEQSNKIIKTLNYTGFYCKRERILYMIYFEKACLNFNSVAKVRDILNPKEEEYE